MSVEFIKSAIQQRFPNDHVRVQLLPRDFVLGYAIEITRTINDQMYDYVGWVSSQTVRLNRDPWINDQHVMAERAFLATIKEISN